MITTVKTSSVVQGMPKYRSMLAGNPAYAPPSFESIATATASGSTNYVEFTSIPSTFKHLQIRAITCDVTGYGTWIRFNSDSGSNYAKHILYGNGSGGALNVSGSSSQTEAYITLQNGNTTNRMCGIITDILDYSSTSKNKTLRSLWGFDNNGSGNIGIWSGVWLSTSAITSIRIQSEAAPNFTSNTTFALYGIKEA